MTKTSALRQARRAQAAAASPQQDAQDESRAWQSTGWGAWKSTGSSAWQSWSDDGHYWAWKSSDGCYGDDINDNNDDAAASPRAWATWKSQMAPTFRKSGSADRHNPTPTDDEDVASSSDSSDAHGHYVRKEELVELFTLYAEKLNAKSSSNDLQRVVELVANLSDSVLKLESRMLRLEGLLENYSNATSSSCREAQRIDITDSNDGEEQEEDVDVHVGIHPDDQKMMLECLANSPHASDASRRIAAEVLIHDQEANRKKNKAKKEKKKKAAAVRASDAEANFGSESCLGGPRADDQQS